MPCQSSKKVRLELIPSTRKAPKNRSKIQLIFAIGKPPRFDCELNTAIVLNAPRKSPVQRLHNGSSNPLTIYVCDAIWWQTPYPIACSFPATPSGARSSQRNVIPAINTSKRMVKVRFFVNRRERDIKGIIRKTVNHCKACSNTTLTGAGNYDLLKV